VRDAEAPFSMKRPLGATSSGCRGGRSVQLSLLALSAPIWGPTAALALNESQTGANTLLSD